MNDPGLDEPIENTAKKIEGEIEEEDNAAKEDEQTFLDPRLYSLHF